MNNQFNKLSSRNLFITYTYFQSQYRGVQFVLKAGEIPYEFHGRIIDELDWLSEQMAGKIERVLRELNNFLEVEEQEASTADIDAFLSAN